MAKTQQVNHKIERPIFPLGIGFLSGIMGRFGKSNGAFTKCAQSVIICPHESKVVEGEIVWEDWTVNPFAIEEAPNGALRIRGYEDRELWMAPYAPLSKEVVNLAIEQGTPLAFRSHPTASGLYLVENAA